MTTSPETFRSRPLGPSSLAVLALLSFVGAAGCTRPTVGFCTIDEQCEFGQYCALPARECTTGVVIRGVFSGGQVLPPTASAASGTFMMVVNADSTMGAYTLTHSVPEVTSIDMFQGKVGMTGIPTNQLKPQQGDVPGAFVGTMALDPDLVRAMKVGNYFLLISSRMMPTGEVRAQLFSSDPADTAEKVSLDGVLSGLQQSPPNASPGSGRVHMELDEATQTITYNYQMTGVQGGINGVHIHSGGFNINGPHICDLDAVANLSVNGQLSEQRILDCVTNPMLYLAAKHLWRIILKSGDAYLNIHSDQFAKGELRAQLLRTPSTALPFGVVLNPIGGTSAVSSGVASFYLSSDRTMLAYNLNTDKVPGVTAAVLTRGAGGLELTCAPLTASGGKNGSQGYCRIAQSPTAMTEIGVTDLTSDNVFLRIKTTANPGGELEGKLVLPKG